MNRRSSLKMSAPIFGATSRHRHCPYVRTYHRAYVWGTKSTGISYLFTQSVDRRGIPWMNIFWHRRPHPRTYSPATMRRCDDGTRGSHCKGSLQAQLIRPASRPGLAVNVDGSSDDGDRTMVIVAHPEPAPAYLIASLLRKPQPSHPPHQRTERISA